MPASATADHPTLSVLTHDPQLPINEIADFYSIAHCKPHLDANPPRPYIWCNSLVTLDGYLSYHEPGDTGVQYPKLSSVDFRMLHSGWAHSDAILITASELRNEPEAQIRVLFDDLIAYRQQVLHKPAQPYLVILTRSGDIPATHPVFNPPQDKPLHARYPILIVTTTQGKQRLPLDVLAGQLNPRKL
ncbi:hypothetical protein BCR44DRAFT_1527539 [Catenaria anguillulae PL171]|uniref:Uncharacterized protein n=1 Tax=Catenaria anguillulae PL171 TaxID=765915 RepID=A0A1Y2I1M6_9FUNG|nr:hypothetical protein BCR44DRAFT_1527539 [Catenaria anguillulae PL171]